ncbi:MAG TPA: hypothetical protein VJ748_08750 [Vitreimonas sp.]|jgi:hypothetical protein|nr:hypothetical protein [Vitreimonas sp.]
MRALVFAVLMLSACASPPAPAPPAPSAPAPSRPLSPLAQEVHDQLQRLDAELSAPGVVAAGFGQTADLGGGLVVRPFAVVEDSRCPANTRCLWEGRLRIRAAVSGRESVLTLGESLETSAGTIEFVVVSPGAWAEWPSSELGPRPAFRFGFRRG